MLDATECVVACGRGVRSFPSRAGCAPDQERARNWLVSPDVVTSDGAVVSWSNARRRGFDYPEAAALWLSWAAWRSLRGDPPPPTETIARVLARLTRDVLDAGGAGKGGAVYLFDACIVAHAAARVRVLFPELKCAATLLHAALRSVAELLAAGRAVLPPGPPGRWSQGFGPHLLRGAALLLQAGRLVGDPTAERLATRIRTRVVPWPHGARRYVHAILYGAEGALLLGTLGEPDGPVDPTAEATALVTLQRAGGGLPAFDDGRGGVRADATAQAVRLWCALDPERFAVPVSQALAFLARRQGRRGGIEYAPSSGDRNTWTTVFADQATAWAEGGAETDRWL